MGKIKELPALERPREKAYRYGIEKLSDAELISVLLGKGYKGENAQEIAANILESHHGLKGLASSPFLKLTTFKGIKSVKAISLAACFEIHRRLCEKESEENEEEISEEYLYNKYKSKILSSKQEVLILVLVNRKRHIIYECTLYKGTGENLIFSYKDMWRELYIHNAHSFYLIHNHPNQEAKPSADDLIYTGEIFRESKRIKIPLIDHIIIGDDGYYSFQKNKKITISC